jgi:phenylalanyl-tRNA synthetase alpha chain
MIAELKDKLLNLSNEILLLISECKNLNSLDEIRINSLGKKGSITYHLKDLKEYDDNSKREIGSLVNEIKNKINQEIVDKTLFFKKRNPSRKIKY